MASHLPEFFERFGIHFTIDGPQLEYFVFDQKTGQDISCSLTLQFDQTLEQVTVMTFYPGICQRHHCRYLSAACFFMVMQHLTNFYHIEGDCQIMVSTRKGIFDTFYALLQDFDFHIQACGEKDRVDIRSRLLSLAMDTSMINQRALADQ